MKKNVIALAVAAAMAAPLAAQAEVTVSGGLQAELTSITASDALKTAGVVEGLALHDAQEGGVRGSGNWGFIALNASEDLGGGLKAVAKYAFNVDVDGKAPAQRDSYVGLSGGFGTVLAGTMNTPYKSSTVKWDPFLTTSGQARGNFGASGLHNGYAGNVVAYANKFGPATFVAGVALDETPDGAGGMNGDHTTTASINAPVGPVEVAVAYLNSAAASASATKVGVKWSSGAIGVNGQFENLEAGVSDSGNDETFILVNATYAMGANILAASYGTNTDKAAGGDITNNHLSIGVVHAFSKSTTGHLAYTSIDADGETANGIAAGLRVGF